MTPRTEPEWEYGVRRRWRSGEEFVSGGYTEAGARAAVAREGGKGWHPCAVEVVRRTVGEWEPAGGQKCATG